MIKHSLSHSMLTRTVLQMWKLIRVLKRRSA